MKDNELIYIITSDDKLFEFNSGAAIHPVKSFDQHGIAKLSWGFRAKLLPFKDAMDFAIAFISSSPDFLRGDEEWMIEYIQNIKSFYTYRFISIYTLYNDVFDAHHEHCSYLAIRATRLFYLIDVIDAILYGGSIGNFEIIKKKPKFKVTTILEPLLTDDDEVFGFSRTVAIDLRKNNFRSYISKSCYSEYSVAFMDNALDQFQQLIKWKYSGLYIGELCNFYKSENFNRDGSFFKNLSMSKDHHNVLSSRLSFYPIVTVQINARDYPTNILGYRVQIPLSCLKAGSSSYSMPNEFNSMNFESYCNSKLAEESLTHKYRLDSTNLADLMFIVNS